MSELNTNAVPAINAVEGFNPADFVRNTVGEEGENDLYLDVKYRLLWSVSYTHLTLPTNSIV